MSQTITARISDELNERLDDETERRGDSKSGVIRTALDREITENRKDRLESVKALRRAGYTVGAMFVFVNVMLEPSGLGVLLFGALVILLIAVCELAVSYVKAKEGAGGVRQLFGV
jgi:predicted DNA-binding protein